MVSRVTDDYQAMVVAGCAAVCEPAFWAGFDRSSADEFYDYFCQLTEHEPRRAAKFGLPHFSWLCINPKESEDVKLASEVIALMPQFLERPNVLGIGEIGLNKNSRNEMKVLEMHVDLAVDMIERYSGERLWMNSACDWGLSVPLAVPDAALELRRRGHGAEAIDKLVYQNPKRFLNQCPKFKLPEEHTQCDDRCA